MMQREKFIKERDRGIKDTSQSSFVLDGFGVPEVFFNLTGKVNLKLHGSFPPEVRENLQKAR